MQKSLDREITQLERKVIDRLLNKSIEPNLEFAELGHYRSYVTYRHRLEFVRSCLSSLLSVSALIYVLIVVSTMFLYLFSLDLLGVLLSTTNVHELYGAGLVYFLPAIASLIGLVWQFIRVSLRSRHQIILITMTLIVIAQFVFSTVMTFQHSSFKRLGPEYSLITDAEFQDMDFGGLMLKGGIGPTAYQSLLKFDKNIDINTIIINSHGGDIASAIAIGQWVSKSNVPVFVKGDCFSTCAIIAVSGSALYASKDAKFFFDQGEDIVVSTLQNGQKIGSRGVSLMELELKSRGMPEQVLNWVRNTPISKKRYITALELKKLGIIDSIIP